MNAPLPPSAWTTGTTEVFKTGTWRSMLPQYVSPPSPCHVACPAGGDIVEWMARARERDFRGAWEVLVRHNPFPAIAGRVCHHPCETACNRAAHDEPLSICSLERTMGDMALQQGWALPPPAEQHDGHVAVVGAGPSGLSAAYHLRRRGWRVTVYEGREQPGGVMRYGIPAYRLPREVLDGEIRRIVESGVELRCGEPVASADDFKRLRAMHDAVYVAAGAGRPKRLPQLPARAPWLLDGADYLAQCNAGRPPALGRRLVVVGGGSAALDVARCARRAGHQVMVLALEPRALMPAQAEELAQALEEGIQLFDGAMLRHVSESEDGDIELRCAHVHFEPGARRGEFSVQPIAGSDFILDADAVIPAIGQDPDLSPFGALQTQGALLATDTQQASGLDGVWAGGDVASMARFVTEAIGMGKRAAIDIDRALRRLARSQAERGPAVAPQAIATWHHPPQPRVAARHLEPAERLAPDAEVQLGISIEEAVAEAARCFSCGQCTACDNCFQSCPDLAVVRQPGGGYAVLSDYCKGCGLCVRECPTGSMLLTEELR